MRTSRVKITDEFMNAVEANEEFALRYGSGVTGRIERKVSARFLWDRSSSPLGTGPSLV